MQEPDYDYYYDQIADGTGDAGDPALQELCEPDNPSLYASITVPYDKPRATRRLVLVTKHFIADVRHRIAS